MSHLSIPQKTCHKCGRELPATSEYFHRNKSLSTGLRGRCKDCVNAESASYKVIHRDSVLTQARKHYHTNHEVELARSNEYNRNHREAKRKYSRLRYWSDPDRFRQEQRDWYKAHPELARQGVYRRQERLQEVGGSFTEGDVALQRSSQRNLCWWCGKPMGDDWSIDHRIPISRGGSNDARNICITHLRCNLSKNNKMPWEYNGRLL